MCSVGGPGRAKLDCSVLEEDWQRGQSYAAHWHSLTGVTSQHHRLEVMEADHSVKHREARKLLQRFLSGAISKNNTHSKTHLTSQPNQPTSDPSDMTGSKVKQDPGRSEDYCVIMKPRSSGLEMSGRKSVVKMTKLQRFLG
ncbi:hypothetical protein EYF80_035325 [Xyrichtys novacula]|nr:hypothetical protein EYF80_035325 [Xyrichtys novacula]